jgi:8-oxo-dGTP diphosphatase
MKTIQVVAAVIEKGEEVLCVQRGAHKFDYIHQKWEFPGGKLEPGETEADAIVREIAEELHLKIDVISHMLTVHHSYPDFHLVMSTYRCAVSKDEDSQQVVLTEHIAHTWLRPDSQEFGSLDWADADRPIVKALKP